MQKLKEIYNIKKDILCNNNINELGNMLKENSDIDVVNVNSDNTIYVESNCGTDSIKNNLYSEINKLIWKEENVLCKMIFNTLLISDTACIIKI